MNKRILIIAMISFIAFGLIYPFAPIDPLPRAGISLLIMIAGLWFTEALPIPITALLIPVLACLLNLSSLEDSLAPFASPVVFLILGGFILSAVLQKNELDRWFSSLILQHCGGHTGKVLIGMFIVTAILSMWMSNASATLMMLPILCSILQKLPQNDSANTAAFGLLGLAYSASLGGMMSLVGSPTNMIIAAQLEIDFFGWMRLVAPAALLFFPLMLFIMGWKLKPRLNAPIDIDINIPSLTRKQKLVLMLFILTCVAWMGSAPLGKWVGIEHSMDTWIILVSGALFVLFDLLKWNDIEKNTQWGILLLSGGGMALSSILQSSGAGEWIAHAVIDKAVANSPFLFVIASVLFLIFITEMMSNAAAAAMAMPILIITATTLDFPPSLLAPLVGVTVSMAFMFPIATPPNAIVYGSGLIPLKKMVSTGFMLNLVGTLFVIAYVLLLR